MTDSPVAPPPESPTKPFWQRWWFIAVVALVALVVIGAALGNPEETTTTTVAAGDTTTTTEVDQTTTTEAEETTTTEAPEITTTEAPETTTTLPPGWDPVVVEGSGDDFLEFSVPNGDPAVLTIEHSGSSNFAVVSYDAANERIDLLVNEIGGYSGRLPINFIDDEIVAMLEITADGAWTVTGTALVDETVRSLPIDGQGDDVAVTMVDNAAVSIEHSGESNFSVIAWSTDGRDLLVNEIGSYSGTVRSPTGTVIYQIGADGAWSFSN